MTIKKLIEELQNYDEDDKVGIAILKVHGGGAMAYHIDGLGDYDGTVYIVVGDQDRQNPRISI